VFCLPNKKDSILIFANYSTFGDYRKEVIEKYCDYSEYVFYFQTEIDKSILNAPLMRPNCRDEGCFKRRNILKLQTSDDLLFINKHLLNYGTDKKRSEHPWEAVLEIDLKDEEPITTLQTIITQAAEAYYLILETESAKKYSKKIDQCPEEEICKLVYEIPFRLKTIDKRESETVEIIIQQLK
jgi:hypothetical protein